MSPYLYPVALGLISALVAGLEWAFPWRKQRQLRPGLGSDLLHLLFNGHFLGVILYGLGARYVYPGFAAGLEGAGLAGLLQAQIAAGWPLWIQIVVVLFGLDLLQWCVHVSLHRYGPLWVTHQTHHSVKDGEMDWIVAFRFQWTEVVVYRLVQYVPLALFGFSPWAITVHAIFGTLIGHLNHANLDLDYGWGRYILNNPRMHLWHHDRNLEAGRTVNFGIIFSLWDWLLGTAYLPERSPAAIGYPGDERHPRSFFLHAVWPLSGWVGPSAMARVGASLAGAALVGGAYVLATG